MRVLVTFAVDAEFAPWRRLRSFHKASASNVECFLARAGKDEIGVLLTGVGAKKAWLETTKRMWDSDVDVCISSGLAGGLRQEHRLGEVLVAEKVLATNSGKVISCDPALVDPAVSSGAKRVAQFFTTDRVILTSSKKRELGAVADAVDMETADVLAHASALGAKVVAIRSISDTVDANLPLDFNKVTNLSGDVSMRRILGEVFSAPSSIPAVVRFGQQSKNAAKALASFLENYLSVLLVSKSLPSAVGVRP